MIDVSSAILQEQTWDSYAKSQLQTHVRREQARRALARKNFLGYVRYFTPDVIIEPFHERLAEELQNFLDQIRDGYNPCLIIEAPPRHGKSLFCSENLPSFAIGYLAQYFKEPVQVLHTGHGQDFINKFGRKNRDRMQDPRYQNIFPGHQASKQTASVNDIITDSRDSYAALGMNGGITGLGGHVIIVDDPVKTMEQATSETEMTKQLEWYMSALSTRAMPRAGKLLIMTRWSQADLAGQLQRIAKESPDAEQWRVLSLPAIARENDPIGRAPGEALSPARYPITRLQRERAGKSPKVWSALYQQNPVPESGGFFELDDFEACTVPLSEYPDPKELSIYVPGDFAIGTKRKNDYTVFWPFGVAEDGMIWFLNDLRRFKGGGDRIVSELMSLGRQYHPRSLILEDGHIFRGIRDTLSNQMVEKGSFYSIDAPWPTQDKLARAEPLRARMQQRRVRFPDVAFMRETVYPEAMAFGEDSVGVHDDTIDAAAIGMMRVSRLHRFRAGAPDPAPETPRDIMRDGWTLEDVRRSARPQRSRRYEPRIDSLLRSAKGGGTLRPRL